MYDITRYLTFKNLNDWLNVFNQTIKEQGQKVSTILVGSKIDLEETRTVLKTDAQNYAKENGFMDYMECSSKSGENVDIVFETIARLMLENTEYLKDI
jgi:GTPase SAR1 family protein